MKIPLILLIAALLPVFRALPQEAKVKSSLPSHFLQRAGTFKAEMTFYQGQGQVAFKAKGTQTNTVTCGGMWMQGELKADMGGSPFHGVSLIGMDPKTKTCSGSWVDSMSSHLMVQKGKIDATGKLITMKTKVTVKNGALAPGRLETKVIDKDHYQFSMYILGKEKDFLSMRIMFTRK